ncbi:MAG: hypothetical protein ACRDIB_18865, partial [Ardenticatenaceae bacterium]
MEPLTYDEAQHQIYDALRRLRTRLRWRDGLRVASQWAWVAAAAALAIQLLARLMPIAGAIWWSVAIHLLALLGWVVWLLLRPLPLERVARRVDAEAHTKERLATALELEARHRQDELSLKQQRDAATAAGRAASAPVSSLPWQWARQPLWLAAALLLATLVAPLL